MPYAIENIFQRDAQLTPHRPVKSGNYNVVVDCYMIGIKPLFLLYFKHKYTLVTVCEYAANVVPSDVQLCRKVSCVTILKPKIN